MKIGIDIDGVLNNLEKYHQSYGTKFCLEKGLSFKFNPAEYKLRNIFSWTQETENEFYETYYPLFLTSQEFLRIHAREVLQQIHEQHSIYILTSRLEDDVPRQINRTMADITRDWLLKSGLCFDYLLFSSPDKLQLIIENDLNIMIEDNPELLVKVMESPISFFCFDAAYNRIHFPDNVVRVHSWYEVLIRLNQFK